VINLELATIDELEELRVVLQRVEADERDADAHAKLRALAAAVNARAERPAEEAPPPSSPMEAIAAAVEAEHAVRTDPKVKRCGPVLARFTFDSSPDPAMVEALREKQAALDPEPPNSPFGESKAAATIEASNPHDVVAVASAPQPGGTWGARALGDPEALAHIPPRAESRSVSEMEF
jgi:hypothetical protein